jgi:plasmid stabilization system protein ParE
MAYQFQLSPRALADLDTIWSYIALGSVRAANRVEASILSACSNLAHHPLQGTVRESITSRPLRFWTVSRYPNFVIVYRPDLSPLRVVAVLHGKRDLQSVLDEPGEF